MSLMNTRACGLRSELANKPEGLFVASPCRKDTLCRTCARIIRRGATPPKTKLLKIIYVFALEQITRSVLKLGYNIAVSRFVNSNF